MCKHRYVPLDVVVLDDEKIERLRSTKGEAAFGVFCAILAKLAQLDKYDYSYPADARMLRLAIKSPAPVSTIQWVIKESKLFEIEGERFFSPRLRKHFQALDGMRSSQREEAPEGVNASEETPSDKPQRNISEESRAKMKAGGRKGKGGGRPKVAPEENKVENKVDTEENKVENKVAPEENKVENKVTPEENKVENKVDTEENKVENKVTPEENKVENKVDTEENKVENKVAPEENKVKPEKKQGLGGTIGGAKRPLKEERLKDKDIRSLPQPPSGGLDGAQEEERWDAERRAIDKIQDPQMRDWVGRLLNPPDLNSFAEVWKEIYAVDTSGVSSFSSPPKMISREMREKAEELYWALVPDPADGSQRPEWRRASPEEVLSIIQRFRSVLQKAKESSFFAKSPACASLAWIIKLDNFSKIEAGNYRDPEPATAPSLGSRGMVNQNWKAANDQVKARVPTQEELDAIEFAKKFTPEDVPF